MSKKMAPHKNIWAHHTYPGDAEKNRIQAEIDALVQRVDTTLIDKSQTQAETSTINLDAPNHVIAPIMPTQPQRSYGAAYKFVNGKQVLLTDVEKERRSRLKSKKTCFVEFAFGFLRYTFLDLIGRPVKQVAAKIPTENLIANESEEKEIVEEKTTFSYIPEDTQTPDVTHYENLIKEQKVQNVQKLNSEDRMLGTDLTKLAYFGVAVWFGITATLATMNTLGIFTI